MSVLSYRLATVMAGVGWLCLTGCSGPRTAGVGTPEFYWAAAGETYAAGDYMKTANHLEHVIEGENAFTARAIPWYLVVTSGLAHGYMELADHYTAGAHVNKANALAFQLKASEYRTVAKRLSLRFAQNVDKVEQVPLGNVPLAFALPQGNAARAAVLSRIAAGIEPTPADRETAETLTVQRGVLLAVCVGVGAPNDVAKAGEILGRPPASTTRSIFGNAIGNMLKTESALFTRDQLDEPEKLAAFQKRADLVLAEAAKLGSARIVPTVSAERASR